MSGMAFDAYAVQDAVRRNNECLQKLEEDTDKIHQQLMAYRIRLQDNISAETEKLLSQAEIQECEIARMVKEMNDGLADAARQFLKMESE